MNGRTFPTHGVCGDANGGVSRHTPGAGGNVGNDDVVPIGVIRPSPVRKAMMFVAAVWPTSVPPPPSPVQPPKFESASV